MQMGAFVVSFFRLDAARCTVSSCKAHILTSFAGNEDLRGQHEDRLTELCVADLAGGVSCHTGQT